MAESKEKDEYEDELLLYVSDTIKQLQISQLQHNVKNEAIGNESKAANILCSALELVLSHGLKSRANGVWTVVKVYCTKSDLSALTSLDKVKTHIGKGRAWLYIALNDKLLESYVRSISTDLGHLKVYYSINAFLLSNKVEMLCTLISGLENFTFQFNANVIYLDFGFIQRSPNTRQFACEQKTNKEKNQLGSSVSFNIKSATYIAINSLKATSVLKSVFETEAATSCCSICRGELICLCEDENTGAVNELPDLVPLHITHSKSSSDTCHNEFHDDKFQPVASTPSEQNKQTAIKTDKVSNDSETLNNVSSEPLNFQRRINPFNTMMDDDSNSVKSKWEEMNVCFVDSPLKVIRKKQKKYKKKKCKTVLSKTSSSEFETCTESGKDISIPTESEASLNDIQNNELLSPPTNEVEPNCLCIDNFKLTTDAERDVNEVNEIEFVVEQCLETEEKSIQFVVTIDTLDESNPFISAESEEVSTDKTISIDVSNAIEIPDSSEIDVELIAEDNTSSESSKETLSAVNSAEMVVIVENHFSDDKDSSGCENKQALSLDDRRSEEDFIEVTHKRQLTINNNMKLFIMLEVLEQEEEVTLQLYEACTGHSEGDWQCLFVLFTDLNIYCMRSGDGNALYKVLHRISYNQVDHILIDINCQALNLSYYDNVKEVENTQLGIKQNINIETGDGFLTRLLINSFNNAFSKFALHHHYLKVTPTIFYDSDYHRVILKKYIQNETKRLPENAEIKFYHFVHWADAGSSKSPKQELAGYLRYKSSSSIIFKDSWKEAFFVLSGSALLRYTTRSQNKPEVVFDVSNVNCFGCKRSKVKHATAMQFEVMFSSGDNLQLRAVDEETVTAWIQAICLAVASDQANTQEPFNRNENNESDDLIASILMISNNHLMIFHEDNATGFCRTLAKCHLCQITEIATEEVSNLICQFIVQFDSNLISKWTLYFSNADPLKTLPSLICNLQKEAAILPAITSLELTVKLKRGLFMLDNKWACSDKLLKGRIKEDVPWGIT